MRRGRAFAIALAGLCAAPALSLRADEIDRVPAPPSVEERIEAIRARVQEAVVYPRAARERGIEGTTRIQFRIDSAGRAAEVITVESSGSPMLDGAAEQAARDARALPQLYGFVRIPVRFALEQRAAHSRERPPQRASAIGAVTSR